MDQKAEEEGVQSSAIDMFKRLIHPRQQQQQQQQQQDHGQQGRAGLLDGIGKQKSPRRPWSWFPHQKSKVSLSDEPIGAAAVTPSSSNSYQSQEHTPPVRSEGYYDLSQGGTEPVESPPPPKPPIEDSPVTHNSASESPLSLAENSPLQQQSLQLGYSDSIRDIVGGESEDVVTSPQSMVSTSIVDSTGDNQQQPELDVEPLVPQDLDSASGPDFSVPVGDDQHQLHAGSRQVSGSSSVAPAANNSTSNHSNQSDPESSLPGAMISPHKEDCAHNNSPESTKAESKVNLEQRFNEHKIETEFHDDRVVQKTYEWERLSSNRSWETSTWKKKGVIGSGNFGTVLLQEKTSGRNRGQLRAVKVIPRDTSQETSQSQELLALVKLRGHEHLFVQFLGWYEDSASTFLAMEYIEHGDLEQYINSPRDGNLEAILEAKEITRQILEGLEVLHGKGIYHRDLKPQNVLMASLDPIWVKIADFGVSKRVKGTSLKTLAGTQGYFAPELLGLVPRDTSSNVSGFIAYALDIWSLGSLVHKLLTYETPFTEVYEDSEPETGIMTGLPSERGTDFSSLMGYCNGNMEFSTNLLEQSPLPVGEEEIAFVKSLLIANPKSRPTARAALQDPWLKGYTNRSVEKLKREFLSLGVDLHSGRTVIRNTWMRQIGKTDIMRYLPSSATEKVLPLLLKAIERGCNLVVSRLLKSIESCEDIGYLDSKTRGRLVEVAMDVGHPDTIEILLESKVDVGALIGDETVLQWIIKTEKLNLVNLFMRSTNDIQTALLFAAKSGNASMINWLLSKGFDINSPNDEDQSVLRAAYANGRIEIFELLLRNKLAVNPLRAKYMSVPSGRTILQEVAETGNIALVKLLLDYKADVNAQPATEAGRTALQAASGGGHADVVKLLLDEGAHVNAQLARCSGRTALQAAAEYGNIDIVQLLLGKGAHVNARASEKNGRTALQAAAERGNIEIVALLLERGANVNEWPRQDGLTALQAAAKNGGTALVKLLLDNKGEVNAQSATQGGRTALQAAAESGNIDTVQLLLENGANVNDKAAEDKGLTALQAASRGGNPGIVKLLLAKNANVNARAGERWGRTALQAAAESGKIDIVRLLLENEAQVNANGAAREGSQTALQAAAGSGDISIVKVLLDSGADVNAGQAAKYSLTALEAAAAGGFMDIVKLLLNYKADVNTTALENRDRTALQEAVRSGDADIVQLLLDEGAHVNAGAGNRTALQVAAERGSIDIVHLLLEKGADVNAYVGSESGQTALQAAAEHGHIDIVQLLVHEGADIKTKAHSLYGRTALEGAIEGGYTEIFKLLYYNKAYVGAGALNAAVRSGNIDTVKLLLHNGVDTTERSKYERNVAINTLEVAAGGGHLTIVELLLKNRDSINGRIEYDEDSGLQAAAASGNIPILQLLLDNSNGPHTDLEAVLGAAARGGHTDTLKLLLDKGVQVRYGARDSKPRSLEAACQHGHIDAVKLLLSHQAGANSKSPKNYGSSICFAAEGGYIDIVKLLLENGADVHTLVEYQGTALQLAASRGHINVVGLLLENMNSVNSDPLAHRRGSALQRASKNGYTNIVKLILDKGANPNDSAAARAAVSGGYVDIIGLLLDNGADLSDGHGRSLLFDAARNGNTGIVKFLLENGVDAKAGEYQSPLEAAAESGNLELVRLFLDNKADTTLRNTLSGSDKGKILGGAVKSGNIDIVKLLLSDLELAIDYSYYLDSTLLVAVQSGDIGIVKLLLENGVNANPSYGETPLQAAAESRNYDIFKLLLDYKADINAQGREYKGNTALYAAVQGGHPGIIKRLIENQLDPPQAFTTDSVNF